MCLRINNTKMTIIFGVLSYVFDSAIILAQCFTTAPKGTDVTSCAALMLTHAYTHLAGSTPYSCVYEV